jgi:hypothetical protein
MFHKNNPNVLRGLLIWHSQPTTISCRIQDAMHIENMRVHSKGVTRNSFLLIHLLPLRHL